MADQRISALTSYPTPGAADVLAIVDTTNGITKKVAVSDLVFKAMTRIVAPVGSANKADYYTDGSADDIQIQQAIDDTAAAGGGIVFIRAGTYTTSTTIVPKSNVILRGEGAATIMQMSVNGDLIGNTTSVLTDFRVEDMQFIGKVNNFPLVPHRTRTVSGTGTQTAIHIDGSLHTDITRPVITNITIRNCIFRNIPSLPIKIFGCKGRVVVTECEFTNNQDAGFIYDEEVIFTNNHVKQCADNGVSLSRGNIKIVCVGNTFENILGDGIWVSGFIGEKGPTEITIAGNMIKDVGLNGICAQEATKYLTITGNTIDGGYFRGGDDLGNDTEICGILIRGFPANTPGSPTDYATNVTVVGNTIRRMPRAGILIDGTKGALIADNLFVDIGSQFYQDGTSLVSSVATDQNIGILFDQPTTVSDIYVFNNIIMDLRNTPFCNYGIYPLVVSGVTTRGNVMKGCRNASNLVSQYTLGQAIPRTTVADADYTVKTGDYLVAYTSLSLGRTVTLPSAVSVPGQYYIIKDEAGGAAASNITVATTSAQTIDGAATKVISSNYGVLRVESNGANWFTL